jgi:death-on-curing protein
LPLLISAINAPAQTYQGVELFPKLSDKAACLFRSLIKNHPFLDGNKRTGVVTTVFFLFQNFRILLAAQGELADLALQ